MTKRSLTRAQRKKIVSEISLLYLARRGDRLAVVLRMEKWIAKYAPGARFPNEKEMDALVKAGKAKYRETLQGFQQGAAEFAAAVCR